MIFSRKKKKGPDIHQARQQLLEAVDRSRTEEKNKEEVVDIVQKHERLFKPNGFESMFRTSMRRGNA